MSDKYETTRKQKDAVYVKIVNISALFSEILKIITRFKQGEKEKNGEIRGSDVLFGYFSVGILVGLWSITTDVCDQLM